MILLFGVKFLFCEHLMVLLGNVRDHIVGHPFVANMSLICPLCVSNM